MTDTKIKRQWREATDQERRDYLAGYVEAFGQCPGRDDDEVVFEETAHGLLVGIAYPFEEFTDAVEAELFEHYHLVDVSYDHRLTDSQVDGLLSGDADALYSEEYEWYDEALYEGARFAITAHAEDVVAAWTRQGRVLPDDLLDEWFYSDQWDSVRFAVYERDRSTPVDDMARNTRVVYVRVRIGDSFIFDGDVTDDLVDHVISCLDYDSADEEALEACIRRMLPECYQGGEHVPFLFGSVMLTDLLDADLDPRAEVTLSGGSLLFEDCWNGAGYNDTVAPDYSSGNLTVTVPRSELRSDKAQFGYSWDSVCGFVQGAYPLEVKVVEKS